MAGVTLIDEIIDLKRAVDFISGECRFQGASEEVMQNLHGAVVRLVIAGNLLADEKEKEEN